MFRKNKNRSGGFRLSLKMKLTLSLSSIAIVLLLSSIIIILEYKRMSSYVSEQIAGDIASIRVAERLTNVIDTYNLEILKVIGDDSVDKLPEFDREGFVFYCDSLKNALTGKTLVPVADSVLYSYSAYMLTSMELDKVLLSDFIDSRTWYFERLQPVFGRLRAHLDLLSGAVYSDLKNNSANYDRGFYRSIIPEAVAVSVGILLILMLLFFIIIYYVNPLYKMLDGLENYRAYNRRYVYTFDGDDQLTELNAGITELTEENRQLKRRFHEWKNKENSEE